MIKWCICFTFYFFKGWKRRMSTGLRTPSGWFVRAIASCRVGWGAYLWEPRGCYVASSCLWSLLQKKAFHWQFCNGLDVLGMLNLIRSHTESMQPYFIHNTDTLLTPALLFDRFHNIDKVEDGTREVMRPHLKRSISECFDGKSCYSS